MLGSQFLEFKLNYSQTKDLHVGDAIYSQHMFAGGHIWRIKCYPYGDKEEYSGEYLSIYLELIGHATDVKAIFDVFLIDKKQRRCVHVSDGFGLRLWNRLVDRSYIEESHGLIDDDGTVTFVCGVVVLRAGASARQLADVASHLGGLLCSADGSDVLFSVGGEAFQAHRAVLAARSPVFKAEVLDSIAEATMPSITLNDIKPETFRDMLHFMYTDKLPDPKKDCSPSTTAAATEFERFHALLVAADRYDLDMLKLVCAQKLSDVMSVDNVTRILRCAELHGCPDLKSKCLDFFTEEKNFKKLVLTEGYLQLVQSFPSLVQEIKQRIESQDTGVLREKGSGFFVQFRRFIRSIS